MFLVRNSQVKSCISCIILANCIDDFDWLSDASLTNRFVCIVTVSAVLLEKFPDKYMKLKRRANTKMLKEYVELHKDSDINIVRI